MRRRVTSFGLVGLCTLALLGASRPAGAACIEVDLAIHYSEQPDAYPLGPRYCVIETPWNHTDSFWFGERLTGLPPGTPSGFRVEVWVASP